MVRQRQNGNTWRMLLVVGGIIVVGGILFAWSRVLFPVIVAFLIAYISHPLASFFERHRLPRIFAFLCVLLVFFSLVVLIVAVFLPAIIHELMLLGNKVPQWRGTIESYIGDQLADIHQRYPDAYALLQERITRWAEENFPTITQRLIGWFLSLLNSLIGLAGGVMSLVLILVITAYLTMDFGKFIDSLRRAVPRPVLPTIERVALDVNWVLKDFVIGQLLVAMALGAMYTAGLLFSGAPLALVVGPVAGILALVPYLGFVFGFGVALLLTLLEYQDFWHALGVILTFGVAQTVEGWFLTPRLLGKRVGLHPVWILVALLLGGELFGLPGIIVAVPVAAALRVVLVQALKVYQESTVYLGTGSRTQEERMDEIIK
jgi:predicted PurR-regulated permease PerM